MTERQEYLITMAPTYNTTKVAKKDDQKLIHKKCFSRIERELKDWIKFIDSKNRK